MNRVVLTLSLLLLIAGGLVLILSSKEGAPTGQGNQFPKSNGLSAAPPLAQDTNIAPEVREDLSPDPEFRILDPPVIDTSLRPDSGILVRVVLAEGGVPRPGATVFAQDYRGLAWEKLCCELATGIDRAVAFRKYAQTYHANEAGEVVLPVPTTELFIRAESDGMSGETVVMNPRPGRTVVIQVEKRLDIAVVVSTSDGELAPGVPICLRGERERGGRNLAVAVSDDNGQAVIPDVLSLLAGTQDDFIGAVIFIPIPLMEPIEAHLDLSFMPNQPINLTLPPTGSVLVNIVDEQGRAVTAQLPVHLARDEYPDYPPLQNWERSNPIRNLHGINQLSRDGVARFPYVGLGLDLAVYAPVNGSPELDAVKAEGPSMPGQEVTVVVKPGSSRRLIGGRLILPNGEPPPQEKLIGLIWSSSSAAFDDWFREGPQTSVEGEFRMVVGDDFVLPATLVLLLPVPNGDSPWQTVCEIPANLPEGTTHLGDLRLDSAPLLVAGNVLYSEGQPIPGAKVRVYAKPIGPESQSARRKPVAALDTYTNHLGAFRIFGSLPRVAESFVFVSSNGAPPVSQQFTPGEGNLEIRMAATSGLSGWVLLAPTMQSSHFELVWSAKTQGRVLTVTIPIEEGSFIHHGLPPGPGKLVVSYKFGTTLPIDRIDPIWELDLELVPGLELKDPRLEGIDLRHLHLTRVSVQDGNGQPIRRAIAVGTNHGLPIHSDGKGTILIPSWRDEESWSIEAIGYRAATLSSPENGQAVSLEPAIPVLVRLEQTPIPDRYSIRVSAFGPGVTESGLGSRAILSARTLQGQLYFSEGGAHTLEVFLIGPPGTAPYRFLPDTGVTPATLFVQMETGDQICTVTIPTAAIEAAVRAIED